MGGVLDWSTTPGSNTSVDGVNIAEGMQAGLVNNGMRAIMALVREWQLDFSGVVTAGAGNAYTITSNQGIAAYADGQRFSFRADRNNTGAATLNVDGRGAKSLRKTDAGALAAVAADDIVADAVYDVVYDVSADVLVIVGLHGIAGITAFGQSLIAAADAAAGRTVLALGTVATESIVPLAKGGTGANLVDPGADRIIFWDDSAGAAAFLEVSTGLAISGTAMTVPGARVLLASKTASASATLDFTELNNAVYSRYLFVLKNVKPATDNVQLRARFSTDGGSTYDAGASDYNYVTIGAATTAETSDATTTFIGVTDGTGGVASKNIGNAATEYGVNGEILIRGAGNAAVATTLRATLEYDNADGKPFLISATGRRNLAQDTDAIRFLMSSGTIASGTVELWGEV